MFVVDTMQRDHLKYVTKDIHREAEIILLMLSQKIGQSLIYTNNFLFAFYWAALQLFKSSPWHFLFCWCWCSVYVIIPVKYNVYWECKENYILKHSFNISLSISSMETITRCTKQENDLKEPMRFQLFSNFWDFGIVRRRIFFWQPFSNYTVENCFLWKILIKTWLVMVTILKLTQEDKGNFNIQNCFVHPNGLTVTFDRFNQNFKFTFLETDFSNETKNFILKNRTVHL